MPVTKPTAGPSLNQDNHGTPFIDSEVPSVPLSDPQAKGMQAECQKLCEYINTELAMVSDYRVCLTLDSLCSYLQLEQVGQRTQTKRIELNRPSGLSHHQTALSDPSHWTLGDAGTWGQVLKTLQDSIEKLRGHKRTLFQSLRELESSMLRGLVKILSCV